MRQAIVTKFHGPTNTKGARVSAKCQAKRIFVSWDDGLGVDENHAVAARMLAQSLGWGGNWRGGGLPDGTGNVYVCEDGKPEFVTERKDR